MGNWQFRTDSHRRAFEANPLDLSIPVAWSEPWCGCNPMAHHSIHCPANAIFGRMLQTVILTMPDYVDPYEPWSLGWDEGWRVMYFCARCERTRGEINGPVHLEEHPHLHDD